MAEFVLSQIDLDNLKAIKSACTSHLETLKSNQVEYDLLSSTKSNLVISDLGNTWASFIEGFVDFIYLANKGAIKTKNLSKVEGLKLGCDLLAENIEGFIQSVEKTMKPVTELQNDVKYNIASFLTDEVTLDDYLNNKLYSKDLQNLVNIIVSVENTDAEYNEDVLRDIKENSIEPISNQYSETMFKINSILRAFYENTFGLYPYPAAFSFQGVDTQGYGAKMKSVSLNTVVVPMNTDTTFQYRVADKSETIYYDLLSKAIKAKHGFNHVSFPSKADTSYSSRCYNLNDILDCDVTETIYYPLETFAISSRSILEARNDKMFKNSGVNSYDEYVKIIDSYIGDLLAKYIYKAMEKYGKTTNESGKAVSISFLDTDFREVYSEIEVPDDKTQLYSNYVNGIMADIQKELNKFIRCICSGYVVSRNDSNEYFKIKVTDFTGKFKPEDTSTLFADTQFTQNAENVVFNNAVTVSICGCTIYEYSFCKDIDLMDKKPLFGYTAARLFKKQGKIISVDNVLLGEDVTGAPLFATKGSPVDISSKLCHRFSAGSRSGKGVITMNILASSLASENVVFYVDRKPDIGSCLAAISEGKMFVVNGGDTNSSEDTFNSFNPEVAGSGNMLSKYVNTDKSKYKREYLTRVFGNDFGDNYAGAFGDFVYMKAMIFALGIITARIHFTANKGSLIAEGIDDLAMNKRVTVVVDEITNWHHLFEHNYLCTDFSSSYLAKSAVVRFYKSALGAELSDNKIKELEDTLNDDDAALFNAKKTAYNEAKEAWEYNKTDPKLLKAFETARNNLDKAIKVIGKKSSSSNPSDLLCDLYWSTFMDKYRAFIDHLVKYSSAGFQDNMVYDNDVFFIGQYINGYANAGDPINFNKDGTVRQQGMPDAVNQIKLAEGIGADDRTRSYMLGFAESFYGGCDWFIGRNIKDKSNPSSPRANQFGAQAMNQELDSWLHTRGNWGYIPGGNQAQYRSGLPESLPEKIVLLKPYLVLNTNDELKGASKLNEQGDIEGYEGTPYTIDESKAHQGDKYKYIYGAAGRVGFADWEKIRLQHVKPQVNGSRPSETNRCYGQLEEGVGLKGLITEYKRTNPEFADAEFDSSWLSESGFMADRIVQRISNNKYSSYMDYLLDMSPDAIICVDDIILAYTANTANLDENEMLRRRFPRYANTGNMSMLTSKSDDNLGMPELNLDSDEFDTLLEASREHQVPTSNVEASQTAMSGQGLTSPTPPQAGHWTNNANIMEHAFDDEHGAEEVDVELEDIYGDEEPIQPTQPADDKWTEAYRREKAREYVDTYLMWVSSEDPNKAAKLSVPQLRGTLEDAMYALFLKYGY